MQCVRCGAIFESHFCPQCGAPAVAAAPIAPPAAAEWPCPRCGTLFRGNFCPRCGLPTAAWAYRPPPSPSGGRSVLSILWTLALVGFIVFAITDFAGLAGSPRFVVPGIQGIGSGQTVNSGLDFVGNWTFNSTGTGSTSTYRSAGGNPGGYLEMTLFGSGARGYWIQPFQVGGSVPFAGSVRLDVQITGSLTSGRLMVFVDSSNSVPDPNTAIAVVSFSGPTTWTSTGRFKADARFADPGLYYLKVAFIAESASGTVAVGFDNVRLTWSTDAGVVLYLPVPAPLVLFVFQDKALFLSYYGFVAAVIVLAAAYHAIRERKDTWLAFKVPLQAIGTRLRSHSAWIAIAQVWMAVTFFQVVVILLLPLAGIEPTTPIPAIDARNAWVFLFELANAGVYEEFAFRLLLIGLPMAFGSIVLRIMEVNRGGTWNGPGSAGRHIAGAWRYLIGGSVRNNSSKETLVAASAFLFASSTIFGLAHAPGWGWWKVIPSLVAGLGFGYLFLRHGIGAAILAHFVNDYASALVFEGVGGPGLDLLLTLLFLGLTVAGAGFFAWYLIDGWRHSKDLLARFRPPTRTAPIAAPPRAYASPMPQAAGSPPTPAPPDPRASMWAAYPSGPAATVRDPGRIPRDYTPSYTPPPYGYPPVRFQCPYCGWVEARYDAGRFTCTRCGRTA